MEIFDMSRGFNQDSRIFKIWKLKRIKALYRPRAAYRSWNSYEMAFEVLDIAQRCLFLGCLGQKFSCKEDTVHNVSVHILLRNKVRSRFSFFVNSHPSFGGSASEKFPWWLPLLTSSDVTFQFLLAPQGANKTISEREWCYSDSYDHRW